QQLLRDGYCLLEGVIPESDVAGIREEVVRDVWEHSLLPRPQGYVPGFLRVNQSLAPYLGCGKVMDLVEALFGPHSRISMVTGAVNCPGIPRGALHADWPHNQASEAHIPAPYPDVTLHLLTMWMLTDFTVENGATIVVPGSHKHGDHPRENGGDDPLRPRPGERRLLGKAGSVGVCDTRLWHAIAENHTNEERVSVIVRYAPWWLNLDPLRPGTVDRRNIVEANNGRDSVVPGLPQEVFDRLPADVKPLVHYSVVPG
ncbi:MAG: phytanoyl-CoA dioxygenase family protein, partial [Acidobacteria bacterium]|nr:phytanoyl-CoA dioxygenase family protein [Acidobacteriota bacterium]